MRAHGATHGAIAAVLKRSISAVACRAALVAPEHTLAAGRIARATEAAEHRAGVR